MHLWDNVDERPDTKPRQKRKAENLDGENSVTANTEKSQNQQARKFVSVKRQKIEDVNNISSSAEFSQILREDADPTPVFTTGEEDVDGYESEDVL